MCLVLGLNGRGRCILASVSKFIDSVQSSMTYNGSRVSLGSSVLWPFKKCYCTCIIMHIEIICNPSSKKCNNEGRYLNNIMMNLINLIKTFYIFYRLRLIITDKEFHCIDTFIMYCTLSLRVKTSSLINWDMI